jgi:hypothetical protein
LLRGTASRVRWEADITRYGFASDRKEGEEKEEVMMDLRNMKQGNECSQII